MRAVAPAALMTEVVKSWTPKPSVCEPCVCVCVCVCVCARAGEQIRSLDYEHRQRWSIARARSCTRRPSRPCLARFFVCARVRVRGRARARFACVRVCDTAARAKVRGYWSSLARSPLASTAGPSTTTPASSRHNAPAAIPHARAGGGGVGG